MVVTDNKNFTERETKKEMNLVLLKGISRLSTSCQFQLHLGDRNFSFSTEKYSHFIGWETKRVSFL